MSAEMPPSTDRPSLLRAALRYRWPAIVLAVAVFALIGTVLGLAKGRSYRSTATVLITPLEGLPYSPESVARQSQANTDALTDARLAATPAVSRLVESRLKLPRNSLTWRSKLSVDVVSNSQVVKISYLSSSAKKARQMAHAFSTAYLRYRTDRSQAIVSGQLHTLQSRAQSVQRRLTAAIRALASNLTSVHRATLNQQVAIYSDQLAALSVQTAQLAGASREPGQVLTPAGTAAATGVPLAGLALVGAIAGLLVGLGFAVVRESRDRRLREPAEVETAGLPLLATLKAPRNGPPDAEEIERYRTLRTAVLTHAPAPRVIEICSLSPTVESGDLAAGLGTALARAGTEATVVLASAGPEPGGELHAGLAEVLLKDADAKALRVSASPRLYLLERGQEIEAAAEMFASEKLRNSLHDLAGDGGYVLVAAPTAGTAAATALAVVSDEVILASPLESRVEDLIAAAADIQRMRGRILGAVAIQPATLDIPSVPPSAKPTEAATTDDLMPRVEVAASTLPAPSNNASNSSPPNDGAAEAALTDGAARPATPTPSTSGRRRKSAAATRKRKTS